MSPGPPAARAPTPRRCRPAPLPSHFGVAPVVVVLVVLVVVIVVVIVGTTPPVVEGEVEPLGGALGRCEALELPCALEVCQGELTQRAHGQGVEGLQPQVARGKRVHASLRHQVRALHGARKGKDPRRHHHRPRRRDSSSRGVRDGAPAAAGKPTSQLCPLMLL